MAPDKSEETRSKVRTTLGSGVLQFVIAFLITAYVVAVLAGKIQKDNKIDTATLGLIGLAAIVIGVIRRPDILHTIKHIEFAGLKVDIEKKLQKQDVELNAMLSLVAPILLPTEERKHLLNLADGKTDHYIGNNNVRSELRHLRSMKLISMHGNQPLAFIQDGKEFDLANYVELTDLGKEWARKIREIEEMKREKESNTAAGAA
jgi:hypothetical protein